MMLWLVTWNADDYCDRGSLTKMYYNDGHPYDSNVIPVIWATFWISGCRFGSTHSVVESPALGILFFGMISESRFVDTHSVVEHTDSWHTNLLA